MLARPCHSPYGASSSAVSSGRSGQRPRSGGEELHEREVGDEARVVAAEAVERDHAHAPRPDAALAAESRERGAGLGRPQRLEIDGTDESRDGCRTAGREPATAERGWGKPRERLPARRVLAAGADDLALELARAAGLDELTADRLQRRMGDGGRPCRPQPAERAHRRAEQGIVREAAVELARVVVEREEEARLLDGALARRAHDHDAVRALPRACPAALGKARAPAVGPRGESQRVETGRFERRLDHASSLDTRGVRLQSDPGLRSTRFDQTPGSG